MNLTCRACARAVTPALTWAPHATGGGRHIRADCPACGRFIKFMSQTVDVVRVLNDQARERERQHGRAPRQGELFGGAGAAAPELAPAPDAEAEAAAWLGDAQAPAGPLPTWAELVALEPRLAGVRAAAARVPGPDADGKFVLCPNREWYGHGPKKGLRDRVHILVGPDSGRTGLLGTSAAREVAGRVVYDALPPCPDWCRCSDWPMALVALPRRPRSA